jgi:membrane protein DedA with SNARE-associated domain
MIRRYWPLVLAAVALLLVAGAAMLVIVAGGGLGLLDEVSEGFAYLIIFALIYGDAIIPLLPGETTLNTAAVLASDGQLEITLVIIAAALGAVLGDSSLYWIARLAGERYQPQVEKVRDDSRIKSALEILGSNAPLLIIFGRYVPGLRFVVNATMGITKFPYRWFLLWSTIGGVTWAIYTALLAYYVGSAIEDYPIASILISGAITTVIIGIIFLGVRHRRPDASSR